MLLAKQRYEYISDRWNNGSRVLTTTHTNLLTKTDGPNVDSYGVRLCLCGVLNISLLPDSRYIYFGCGVAIAIDVAQIRRRAEINGIVQYELLPSNSRLRW